MKSLASVLGQTVLGHDVRTCTKIGLVDGVFANEEEISQLTDTVSVEEFYQHVMNEVEQFYKVLV